MAFKFVKVREEKAFTVQQCCTAFRHNTEYVYICMCMCVSASMCTCLQMWNKARFTMEALVPNVELKGPLEAKSQQKDRMEADRGK